MISAEIKRRWNLDSVSKVGISEILKTGPLIACIIDPRFKQFKFLGVEKQIEVKAALTRLACEEKDRQDSQRTETLQTESTSQNNDSIANKKRSGWPILLGNEYTNESPTLSFESDPVLQEVDTYLKEKPLDREESLLAWWRDNSHRFPLLLCIARKYLTILATFTTAECVFSTAGLTVTKLRSCLSPEHANMLVYLNKNCLS